jgi:hypothetical protein
MGKQMAVKYCFDTYALIEMVYGNKAFTGFLDEEFIVADLTLAEFYITLLRKHNKATAEYWLRRFRLHSLPVPLDLLIQAVLLKQERKKLSFFDAAGYALAQHLDCMFVTGDQAFENMSGVEHRK